MDRIELKADDIDVQFCGCDVNWLSEKTGEVGEIIIHTFHDGKPRLKKAEQLKKQILEDYEFREEFDDGQYIPTDGKEYKELKEKAEKWDNGECKPECNELHKFHESKIKQLEAQNKKILDLNAKVIDENRKLKEQKQLAMDDMQGVWRQYDRIKEELQKYKQVVESVNNGDIQIIAKTIKGKQLIENLNNKGEKE